MRDKIVEITVDKEAFENLNLHEFLNVNGVLYVKKDTAGKVTLNLFKSRVVEGIERMISELPQGFGYEDFTKRERTSIAYREIIKYINSLS